MIAARAIPICHAVYFNPHADVSQKICRIYYKFEE
jgi:hypothetical protein